MIALVCSVSVSRLMLNITMLRPTTTTTTASISTGTNCYCNDTLTTARTGLREVIISPQSTAWFYINKLQT